MFNFHCAHFTLEGSWGKDQELFSCATSLCLFCKIEHSCLWLHSIIPPAVECYVDFPKLRDFFLTMSTISSQVILLIYPTSFKNLLLYTGRQMLSRCLTSQMYQEKTAQQALTFYFLSSAFYFSHIGKQCLFAVQELLMRSHSEYFASIHYCLNVFWLGKKLLLPSTDKRGIKPTKTWPHINSIGLHENLSSLIITTT